MRDKVTGKTTTVILMVLRPAREVAVSDLSQFIIAASHRTLKLAGV
jgi:hypothetical protein